MLNLIRNNAYDTSEIYLAKNVAFLILYKRNAEMMFI